ncbi:MAG TPA: LAGLIDADG family homing endonuclease [Pyrinomonadaceae bacterium]|nr:LAGLIDADG family homing endonuclease [Pyrinomonadaceae bacterium]
MKPNDENGKLPTAERPFRVLIISGSDRRQYNCPGVDSKSRTLMLRMAERLPQEWEIDYEDLGNVYARARIQSCNACVSTSMALCVWPCLPASERVMGEKLKSIAELQPGDSISTGRVARAWMSAPRAQVYRLRLSDGRQVRLTGNHPVKVIREVCREKINGRWKCIWKEEWIEAAKLRAGDKIPFPLGEQCGTFRADSETDSFYFLLAGAVFGDGSFAGAGQVRLFFDSRQPAMSEALGALSPTKMDVRRQVYATKETGWPRTADAHMRYDCWDTGVGKILLEKLDLNKREPVAARRLPQSILDGSEREVCAFLRGWFSADGSVDFHGTKVRVSLASSSVLALREAQMLLAKLGIRSCVYDMSAKTIRMGGKDYSRSSTLQITKREGVARFAELIGFLDEKAIKLTALLSRQPQAQAKRDTSAGTNRNYGRVLDCDPEGIEPVYDINVEPSHEFVAELVPVHNCNCYEPDHKSEPDLMWDLNMYARLDLADAWAIIGPINWYAPTSNLKLMFDRLVCMNGGNPREDLIEHKDAELARRLEHSEQWEELSLNHLEGRTAAFYCYGDGGGDELDATGRPKILRHKEYFDPRTEPFENDRDAYAPLVWQCRYGGVEVPDELWRYLEFGRGKKYSDNQAEDMAGEQVYADFDAWTDAFARYVGAKGKVEPGKYRAYGYEAPGHLMKDLKAKWREIKTGLGYPPAGSSVEAQQKLGLNKDATLQPKKSEGEKLRED